MSSRGSTKFLPGRRQQAVALVAAVVLAWDNRIGVPSRFDDEIAVSDNATIRLTRRTRAFWRVQLQLDRA